MARLFLVLASVLGVAHTLRVPARIVTRARPLLALIDERPPPDESDEERRARLERLGREAAAEDAAGDDGGLMAEFNARLDQEGGATLFSIKSGITNVGETAGDAAKKAQQAGNTVVDSATGWASGLSEQQRNVVVVVVDDASRGGGRRLGGRLGELELRRDLGSDARLCLGRGA